MSQKKLVLDKTAEKLQRIHLVTGWFIEHWGDFPEDLYQFVNGSYVPYDVKQAIIDILNCDTANVLTLALNWRIVAESEGVTIPTDGDK